MIKNIKKAAAYTLVEVMFVVGAVASLGIGGATLYIAIHFLSKVW